MDPFESMRSLATLWGQGSQAFVESQQGLYRDMAEKMRAASEAGVPIQGAAADAAGFEAARESFAALWSSASELSGSLTRALQGGQAQDPMAAEMLAKLFDPKAWFAGTSTMDESLQKLAEGPRLADLWDTERKFAAVFNAWVALRRRNLEHNTVMLDAWIRATGAFSRELNLRTEKGGKLESWREVLALWVETANETLLQTQRSEAFLKSQRENLKAGTDLRLAQRELAEYYSEMFGYPTRAELDDVHKAVTELRRELRGLKRESRAASQAVRPPAPSRSSRSKRASRKRKEAQT
jgi:hypothetical protein